MSSISTAQCWRALKDHNGNKSAAARSLGMARSTFRIRLGQAPSTATKSSNEHTIREFKRIMVLGDSQVKAHVPLNFLSWVRRYALEHKNDIHSFVDIGDFCDVHSLSFWDRGKLSWQGRSIQEDIDCSLFALDLLFGKDGLGIEDTIHLDGNHEARITTTVDKVPELNGLISIDSLGYKKHFKTCADFGEIVWREGVAFSHFFKARNTPRPVGGMMQNKLNKIGFSFIAGHEPGLQMHSESLSNGQTRAGVINGASYLHYEEYKGHQDNGHFRGIVMLNEVWNGSFQPQPISMAYLCYKYEGMTIEEFAARPDKWVCFGDADKEAMRWAL